MEEDKRSIVICIRRNPVPDIDTSPHDGSAATCRCAMVGEWTFVIRLVPDIGIAVLHPDVSLGGKLSSGEESDKHKRRIKAKLEHGDLPI